MRSLRRCRLQLPEIISNWLLPYPSVLSGAFRTSVSWNNRSDGRDSCACRVGLRHVVGWAKAFPGDATLPGMTTPTTGQ